MAGRPFVCVLAAHTEKFDTNSKMETVLIFTPLFFEFVEDSPPILAHRENSEQDCI
jgi:hypothetical protein